MAEPEQAKPSAAEYDAYLGLGKDDQGRQTAFAVVKFTYAYTVSGSLKLDAPLPLHNNIFDDKENPRLKPGCDFWPYKLATDIALQGKARAANGTPVSQMRVLLSVGPHRKQAAIFGRRTVSYGKDKPLQFSAPDPFESIDLTYENAYGGLDWRVPIEEKLTDALKLRLQSDHPGMYPRNPFGKAYVVLTDPEDLDGIELPNVENPDDLLTPRRFFANDPRNWHLQPLPWSFDWMRGHTFPRCAFFGGADGWYPAPEDSVTEVRMGLLPKNYRTHLRREFERTMGIDSHFFNEASIGLAVPYLSGTEPVTLQGFQPEGEISLRLPGAPQIEIRTEGKAELPTPILHSVLFLTETRQVCLVWGATVRTPREFIPGIHKTIPIECRVDKGKPFPFPTPVPVKEAIKKAEEEKKKQ